jgi:hypothetical protein
MINHQSSMKKLVLASGLVAFMTAAAQAQFYPGNLAVLRCGNGTNDIINKTISQTVFIDQYTTNGALVPGTTVAITTNGPNAMVMEGGATSEGGLTRSMDRTLLAITGYNTNVIPGVEFDTQTAAAVPRNIGTVDAFGNYLMVQIATGEFTKQDPRFVVTDGTNNFWAVGGASGVVYLNPPSSPTAINTSIVNNRAIRIFNGNLYFSSQKSTPIGVYTIYTAVPSNGGVPAGLVESATGITNLVVPALAGNASDFAISPDGGTVYVADTALGIQKYTISGPAASPTVVSNYTIAVASGSQPRGAFALAVDFSGTYPVIYATSEETNATSSGVQAGNHLVRIVDTGASATFTDLAQAKTNEVFRGIDFAPDLCPLIVTQPQPQSQTVTFGSPASITVSASSPYALSYQWQQNGTNLADNSNITGSTTATLNIAGAVSTNAGNYTVVITNQYSSQYANGAITSSVAVLNVSAPTPPTITTQPLNQTNFIGGAVSFTVAATGAPTPAYQWEEVVNGGAATNTLSDANPGANGEIYSGSTSATLYISNVQTNDSGNYYFATVSNPAGSTNSQNAFLTVFLVPPGIVTQPAAQTVLPGQTVTFNVVATGSYLAYQWMFITNGGGTNLLSDMTAASGETFSGTATGSMTITGVQTNDGGYYAVAVANSAGATNSQTVLLTVLVLPPPSFISYSSSGSIYTQNFDSLPNLGANYTVTQKPANPVTIDGTNYSFGTISDIFDFAAPILTSGLPGGLGLSNTMSGWFGWAQGASGSNTNYFGANAGDYTTGGIEDFGPTNSYAASMNRALGLQTTSSFGPAAFAARFINNTPDTLADMNLQFTGELWRQSNLPKTLSFYYVIDATGTNVFDTDTNHFVYLTNLNVTFPTNAADVGGTNVDGTLPVNQTVIGVANQAITNWPPGAALWLVWEYTDTTGKAQGIGIDNLSFSATSVLPSTVITPLNITAGSTRIAGSGASAAAQFSFTNAPGLSFSVLATNNVAAPVADWPIIGTAVENPAGSGQYHFTDPNPATNAVLFYILRQP